MVCNCPNDVADRLPKQRCGHLFVALRDSLRLETSSMVCNCPNDVADQLAKQRCGHLFVALRDSLRPRNKFDGL